MFPGVGVQSCKCLITGRNYSDTAFCESDFVQKRSFLEIVQFVAGLIGPYF